MKNIAIFASGSGTNAENIIKYFRDKDQCRVTLVLTNRTDAAVIDKSMKLGVEVIVFNKKEFYSDDKVLLDLKDHHIDLVVLAGFLWLVPENILANFPKRIINIHPALLPRYGGKGMYGKVVHEAVKQNGDKKTGITIHYVNENYDDGDSIFQKECAVNPDTESIEEIANKVHALEYEFYPKVIEQIVLQIK